MDLVKLVKKVEELIAYPTEANWFEFKTNWYEPNGIGEYISSLSNQISGERIQFVLQCLMEQIKLPPCIL